MKKTAAIISIVIVFAFILSGCQMFQERDHILESVKTYGHISAEDETAISDFFLSIKNLYNTGTSSSNTAASPASMDAITSYKASFIQTVFKSVTTFNNEQLIPIRTQIREERQQIKSATEDQTATIKALYDSSYDLASYFPKLKDEHDRIGFEPNQTMDAEYVDMVFQNTCFYINSMYDYFYGKVLFEGVQTEWIPAKLVPNISKVTLNNALSSLKYQAGPFSISIGELVNRAMGEYEVTFLSGQEAVEQKIIKVEKDTNLDYIYVAIISGDVMENPDLPYLTHYEEHAVTAWMQFDEQGKLDGSNVSVCDTLHGSAFIIISNSSSY